MGWHKNIFQYYRKHQHLEVVWLSLAYMEVDYENEMPNWDVAQLTETKFIVEELVYKGPTIF